MEATFRFGIGERLAVVGIIFGVGSFAVGVMFPLAYPDAFNPNVARYVMWLGTVLIAASLLFFVCDIVRYLLIKGGVKLGPALASIGTALIVMGALVGLIGAFRIDDGDPGTGANPSGRLTQLSNAQLGGAVIEYAKRIRTFEVNAETQIRVETSGGGPLVPPDYRENLEARAAFSKAYQENSTRQMAKQMQMGGQMQLVFRNDYATQGRELEGELLARLARAGILAPYGKQYERMVLTGFFSGPHPISDCADYLERNARTLLERSGVAKSDY